MDPANIHVEPPLQPDDPRAPAWNIRRVAAELPREARAAVERMTGPLPGGAYRAMDTGVAHNTAWYLVVLRAPPGRGRALVWPAVRTAVPASASAALLGSLVVLAGSLDPVGVVGTALGGVLGAVVARTQYKLERDQHALGALWLAADYSRVLVGRYDSLNARLTGKARWYVLPLDALAAPNDRSTTALSVVRAQPAGQDEVVTRRVRRWYTRMGRVAHALAALGIDSATIDPLTELRVYTLARLARFRRFARGA
jgi:hypothetical protein